MGDKDGLITTVHITDVNLDGPIPRQFCHLKHLREFDVDGGQLTGPFPRWFMEPFPKGAAAVPAPLPGTPEANSTDISPGRQCLSNVQELDFSYNRVRALWVLCVRYVAAHVCVFMRSAELWFCTHHGSQLTGTIPPEISQKVNLQELKVEANFVSNAPACDNALRVFQTSASN